MTDSKNKTCSQCGCIHAQRHHYHFVLNTGADQTKQGDASSGSSLEWTHTFSCGNGETQQISESVHKPNEHYKKEDQGEARITSGIPIVALSWQHGHNYGSDFAVMNSLLLDRGIAMAFAEEVEWSSFTGHHKAGRTPVAELEIPILDRYGLLYWTKLRMTAHPITDLQIENDLLVDWTVLESANTSPGFCLIAETGTHFDLSIDWDMPFRLVFYADFVVNTKGLAVDGNFIGGKLPTGVSGGGGTFRSWFWFYQWNDESEIERKKREQEQFEKDKQREKEKLEQDQKEREQREKEKLEQDRQEREQLEKDKQREKEKLEQDRKKREQERSAQDQLKRDQLSKVKLEKGKADSLKLKLKRVGKIKLGQEGKEK